MMTSLNEVHLQSQSQEELIALILKQNETIEVLQGQIKHLQEQLAKNSRNSGKPPSSDGLQKPKPKSLREKGKRPSGGQKGHAGHRLEPSCNPDAIVRHPLVYCPCCQGDLGDEVAEGVVKRQVIDVPPLRMVVTEHQIEKKWCARCRQTVQGVFPPTVRSEVQYGERLKAQIVYLSGYQLLPSARLTELIQDFYGQPISEGWVSTVLEQVSEAIHPSLVAIEKQLVTARVAHSDETGCRVAGRTQWWHVLSTPTLTYYGVHPKRGQVALRELGLVEKFAGCLVHDAFASYFVFDHCQHALCNAHLLRELIFVFEEHGQAWAGELKNLLLDMKAAVALTYPAPLLPAQITAYTQRYLTLVQQGWHANPLATFTASPKPGRVKKSTTQNLLQRLEKYQAPILAFMLDPAIPFDNNLAERDLRMVKVKQKISGCFRTQHGANTFAQLRSFISTARKQAANVLLAIADAFAGQPFILTLYPE